MARKVFVLDTSAIISLVQNITTFKDINSPGFAGILGDNEIIIPRVVLDELDRLKSAPGERGKLAVDAARQLEYYTTFGSLIDGIETEKGGLLKIAPRPSLDKIEAFDLRANMADHEILMTAIECEEQVKKEAFRDNFEDQEEEEEKEEEKTVLLITQDRILRVLARSIYKIKAEELRSIWAPEEGYERGYKKIMAQPDAIDEALTNGSFKIDPNVRMNQFCHLVDENNPELHYCYGIARDPKSGTAEVIDRTKVDYLKVAGEVAGRNVRQKLLLWALMGCGDPDPMSPNGVRMVTVAGPAGSGKSFLTLAAAWERLERGHFDRIVITQPMIEIGKDLGYLPGSLEEKIKPWGGLIEDNLRAIVNVPSPEDGRQGQIKRGLNNRPTRQFDAKSWLEMENRLELIPLSYIRGRTFRRSFVILEEAQNIEKGPLKVLLTRLGEGSFVVVLGDYSQIDNQFLSTRNNGLIHAINAFSNWPQSVHISLKDIVRSDLAQAATQLL